MEKMKSTVEMGGRMNGKQIEQVLKLITNNETAEEREQALSEAARLLKEHLGTARAPHSGARAAQYERMLRSKVAAIRDDAMELQAVLEFAHRGDATDDAVWQFADHTLRHAEEIMRNTKGELSLPE
jgi:hypothetical protein